MRCTPLFLLALLLPVSAVAQTLRVTAVSPAQNALAIPADPSIVIDFDAPVDPATFDPTTVMVLGRWSGVMNGTFSFENNGTRVRFVPARAFSAGERVTVSLARRLASEAGTTLARGYAWQFWIRTHPASLDLNETARIDVRTPQERDDDIWIQTYGAYAGDLNGDGYSDLAVPNERTSDVRVFMNDGAGGYGSFRAYPIPAGNRPSTNEGADFNLDGHLDIAIGNSRGDQTSIFFGDGTGHLNGPHNYTTGEGVRGLAVLDADGDGLPDIATAHRIAGTVTLLTNDGDLGSGPGQAPSFTLTHSFRQTSATAIAAADATGEGVLDLFVGAYATGEMSVYFGDGDGGFRPGATAPADGPIWMIATGDVNGDGTVDVVSANATGPDGSGDSATVFLVGDHGQFVDVTTYAAGAFPLAIDLGDLDGDGDLDLVTSNFNSGTWTIFENAGDGTFTNPRTLFAVDAGSCAVLHDRDGNGTLDVTGIDELADLLFLFTNTAIPTDTEVREASARALPPAYPNPFAHRATLTVHLEAPAPVHLTVYDVLGRAVRTLVNGPTPAGIHPVTWNGTDDAGHPVPAGIYFYRLETPSARRTRTVAFSPE